MHGNRFNLTNCFSNSRVNNVKNYETKYYKLLGHYIINYYILLLSYSTYY